VANPVWVFGNSWGNSKTSKEEANAAEDVSAAGRATWMVSGVVAIGALAVAVVW